MFEHIQATPADPIFGLDDAFRNDPNPKKIDLGVGVYKDEQGETPILKSVKQADDHLLSQETSKSYLNIEGAQGYRDVVQALLFGEGSQVIAKQLANTAHTLSVTGALRVAAKFIRKHLPE